MSQGVYRNNIKYTFIFITGGNDAYTPFVQKANGARALGGYF